MTRHSDEQWVLDKLRQAHARCCPCPAATPQWAHGRVTPKHAKALAVAMTQVLNRAQMQRRRILYRHRRSARRRRRNARC